MTTVILRNIDCIYTCDDENRAFRRGYILVRDCRIAEIGHEPWRGQHADISLDLTGCVVIPGLVNTHHHFFQSIARGIPATQRASAIDWLAGLYPLWSELDPEALYWASMAATAELLLTGATTTADHSYLMPAEDGDFVGSQVNAAADSGIRLHLVRGSMPTMEGDLATRLLPVMGKRLRRLQDRDEELIPAIEDTIRIHHDSGRHSMLRIALGPTGVSYDRPDFMRKMAEIAESANCGLHTHYLPRQFERTLSRQKTGKEPLDVLAESGWLRPGTWFAHCTELEDDEIRAFAENGCGVAHCPRTIVRLGYRVPRIAAMQRQGVTVGIGVDGASSNDSGSMLNEVRLGLLLHRVNTPDDADPLVEWMTPYQALLMATRNGAAILGRNDIGHLAPDMSADIAAFNLGGVSYVGASSDPLAALLMCGSESKAQLTMVNGRIVVENGKLASFDEDDIASKAGAAGRRMLSAAERNTGIDFSRPTGEGPRIQMTRQG